MICQEVDYSIEDLIKLHHMGSFADVNTEVEVEPLKGKVHF